MFRKEHIDQELKKSVILRTWGRDVILAIDLDNPTKIINIFNKKYFPEANIDEQATRWNYAGYCWTPRMHEYMGDTALHIAIKQRKMMAIHALLLMNANERIKNTSGLDADNLAHTILNTTIKRLRAVSQYEIMPFMNPNSFHLLPQQASLLGVEKEALNLLKFGRCLYSEVGKCRTAGKLNVERAAPPLGRISQALEETAINMGGFATTETEEEIPMGMADRLQGNRLSQEDFDTSSSPSPQSLPPSPSSVENLRKRSSGKTSPSKHTAQRSVEPVMSGDGLEEILSLIRTQMDRYRRIQRLEQVKRSGLTLLANATAALPKAHSSSISLGPGVDRLRFGRSVRMSVESSQRLPLSSRALGGTSTSGDATSSHPQSPVAAAAEGGAGVGGAVVSEGVSTADPMFICELSSRSNLKYMTLGDNSAAALAKALKGERVISSVVLVAARITCEGASALSNSIPSIHSLVRLDLSQNAIADRGAQAVARALSQSTSLNELILSANRIQDAGAAALVDAALKHASLRLLNMSNNAASEEGRRALAAKARCRQEQFQIEDDHTLEDTDTADSVIEMILPGLDENSFKLRLLI